MSKRIILIFLIVAVLGAVGYYAYSKWAEARARINLWTLVPEDAVFIIETDNHQAFLEHLKKTDIWENISELPYFEQVRERMATLDSLAPGKNKLERFLANKKVLTSIHVTGKTDFEYVAYIPVESVAEHRYIRTLTENITKKDRFRQQTRQYQGYQVTDIKFMQSGGQLTYFTYHNNLIISASPVLVEEIIRRISRKKLESPAKDYRRTNYLAQEDVFANVFINYRNLPGFLALFVNESIQPDLNLLLSLCRNSMMQLKLENNRVYLNGFSNPEDASDAFYRCLEGQEPKSFGLQQFISNRAAVLLHFGLDQADAIKKCRPGNQQQKRPEIQELADSLAAGFDREVAVCYLESYRANTSPEKVMFAHTSDPEHTQKLVNEIISQQVALTGERIPDEKYGKYAIRLINIPEFAMMLFGPVFKGFEQCYLAQVGPYVAFSDDAATLRSLLADVDAENVWGKSAQQKKFLDESQHQANLSFYVNTINAWHILNRYSTEEKRAALLRHQGLIKKFNHFSYQFSKTDGQYYTSILLRHEESEKKKQAEVMAVDQAVAFRSQLVSRPFPVRNLIDRSPEVLVQDSAYRIYNISSAGKITWKDSVAGPIAGNVFQAALTKDGKEKYVFAAGNKIYSFDRHGKATDNFPFNLSDSVRIQQLALFDYDKDHNYRLLVDDYLGNIFMFDALGNNLAGWSPKAMDYRLAMAPQHYTISGKDVILVVLENGYVYALNRKGEAFPGFPISLRGSIKTGIFANPGINFRKSEFTVVTQQGEVISFNLSSEILDREQLLRTGRRAVFELVPENSGKSYIIARQDLGKVTLFDQDLNTIFEKTYVTSASKLIQFFHFGGDRKIYVVTETGPQKTYIYDSKGKLIGDKTIESRQPVTILYNDATNSYYLYSTHQKQLKRISFKL